MTGVDGRPLGTLGDVLAEHRRRRFVGRSAEIELLRAALVLVQRLVETVPDSRHRRALGACAVARCTTEALLREVLGEEDSHDLFRWLRGLSFIEPRADGLAPHDPARDDRQVP